MKNRKITEVLFKENQGLTVCHEGEREKGRKGVKSLVKETVLADPTESFTKAMNRMKEHLMRSTSAAAFENAFESGKLAEAFQGKELPKIVKEALRFVAKSITVDRVKLKYSDADMISAKIYGSFTNRQGETMKIQAPAIQMDQGLYGWEGTLKENIQALLEEVDNYLKGDYTLPAPIEEEKEEVTVVKKPGRQTSIPLPDLDEEPAEKPVALPKGLGGRMRVAASNVEKAA